MNPKPAAVISEGSYFITSHAILSTRLPTQNHPNPRQINHSSRPQVGFGNKKKKKKKNPKHPWHCCSQTCFSLLLSACEMLVLRVVCACQRAEQTRAEICGELLCVLEACPASTSADLGGRLRLESLSSNSESCWPE